MMNSLVSVVIPAYNSADTVARAIDSVLRQAYPALEILLVDDGSTDGTSDFVAARYRNRVRLLRRQANGGASAARNDGINAADGEYVAFLDADDEWMPDKLDCQVRALRARPYSVLVTCDALVHRPSGRVFRVHEKHPAQSGHEAWRSLLADNFIQTSTVLARREDLVAVGGFDITLPIAEDQDLWIKLALRGEVTVIQGTYVHIYDRPGSLTKGYGARELEFVLPMIERHITDQAHRMSPAGIRHALGCRHFSAAAGLYARGAYGFSVSPFRRAAMLGYRPCKSLISIARALGKTAIKLLKEQFSPSRVPGAKNLPGSNAL